MTGRTSLSFKELAVDSSVVSVSASWRLLRTPLWISRLVFLVGLVSVVSAFSPEFRARTAILYELVPGVFPAAATTGAAAAGLILIALSRALRRGKFRAWVLALILTATATVLHLLKGLDVEEGMLCLLITGLLVASRKEFTARPDPRSLKRLLAILIFGPAIATGAGFIWLTVDADGQGPGTSASARLAEAALGLIGIPGPIKFVSTASEDASAVALVVLGAAVLLVAVLAAMRPAGGPHPLSVEEEGQLRGLLAKWGWMDSLGYFGLRDDRSVLFSPDQRAAITYRVVGGVSLAGGDPIGDPSSWSAAITGWLDEARSYGWTPAALGASETGAAAYHRAGLDVLELGDEAVVRSADFTLEGRAMRGVRHAVARCTRAGITITVQRMAEVTPAVLRDISQHADAWRDGPVERGFSMALGRFGDPCDDQAMIVLARQGNEIVGFLHFVPWGTDGLSLDLMRRSRDSANGIVETMVAGLMTQAPDHGITRVSLNFAVFRSVFARGERLGAGPALRLWHAVLVWASRFWQIESLYRANAKYHPEWLPRYIVFRNASDLPRVSTAALRAEAFLVLPSLRRRGAAHSVHSHQCLAPSAVEHSPQSSGPLAVSEP
jgi:lysyl-tRNA synthetase class 2